MGARRHNRGKVPMVGLKVTGFKFLKKFQRRLTRACSDVGSRKKSIRLIKKSMIKH